MNLRDLSYLVALADCGHFGRAAERCHALRGAAGQPAEVPGAPLPQGRRHAVLRQQPEPGGRLFDQVHPDYGRGVCEALAEAGQPAQAAE